MLTGEYRHAVDAKKRLFIPAKHREELGISFMIVRDIRGPRLKVYSMEAWAVYVAPIMTQERRLCETAMRFLHRDAVTAVPDSQGRVVLPETLLRYAQIEGEAVIVGCGGYAEIWSARLYDQATAAEDPAELREELEKLGL